MRGKEKGGKVLRRRVDVIQSKWADGMFARRTDTSSVVKGVKKKMGHMCR